MGLTVNARKEGNPVATRTSGNTVHMGVVTHGKVCVRFFFVGVGKIGTYTNLSSSQKSGHKVHATPTSNSVSASILLR